MNPIADSHHHPNERPAPAKISRPWRTALIMLGLIALFFALREHWGHLLGYMPYLVLLLCPLMHLFMHHGHGEHHHHGSDPPQDKAP